MFLPVPASRPSYYCIVLNGVPDRKVQLVPKFKEYDHDKNGYITLDEASRILQNPPYSFPAGRVGILLRKFDKDGNGKLDIEEFADFYAEAKATYVFWSDVSAFMHNVAQNVNHFAYKMVGIFESHVLASNASCNVILYVW